MIYKQELPLFCPFVVIVSDGQRYLGRRCLLAVRTFNLLSLDLIHFISQFVLLLRKEPNI